jgi:hypothetical protein
MLFESIKEFKNSLKIFAQIIFNDEEIIVVVHLCYDNSSFKDRIGDAKIAVVFFYSPAICC